ncbi:hypothetical protein M2267_001037 [Ensifer sp. KUDG1]
MQQYEGAPVQALVAFEYRSAKGETIRMVGMLDVSMKFYSLVSLLGRILP